MTRDRSQEKKSKQPFLASSGFPKDFFPGNSNSKSRCQAALKRFDTQSEDDFEDREPLDAQLTRKQSILSLVESPRVREKKRLFSSNQS